MAGNTQMNENERGVLTLGGLIGYFIAVALLLSILGFLTYKAIIVQQAEASNFYKIDQDLKGLTSGSIFSDFKQNTSEEQNKNYKLVGNKK